MDVLDATRFVRSSSAALLVWCGCMGDALPTGIHGPVRDAGAVGGNRSPTDAGGDGGTVDGGAGDVDSGGNEGDAGTTNDCTGDVICDNFEQETLGDAPSNWQVVVDPPGVGSVLVDDTHAFSGTRAVRLTTGWPNDPSDPIPHVQMLAGLSLTSNAFFGRMMVWIDPFTSTGNHWNLIEGWGYIPGSVGQTLAEQEMYEYGGVCSPAGTLGAAYLNDTTDCCQPSTEPVPVSRWACVEWQFDGINSQMRFWLDGQAIDSLTVTANGPQCGGTWSAPAFQRVDLGWASAPNGVPVSTMWIDDVGINSERIGCPSSTASTH
jgi:hypothetical protein